MVAPRALQRGLRVLELLSGSDTGLSFAEVAAACELADSSTGRLLEALRELDYVSKDASDGRYRGGPALARLHGGGWQDRLLRVCRPFLRQLRDACGNTALLIADTGPHMLVLDRAEHDDSITLQPPGRIAVNWRMPPWGWIFRDADFLARQPGGRDVPAMARIRQEHRRLRAHGYTLRVQTDRRRLAAPVYDSSGQPRATLALGGTPVSLPDADLDRAAATLVACAASCTALLAGA